MKPYITVQEIRAAVRDPLEILEHVAQIPYDSLDGFHHACPKCGGKDRFRLLGADSGTVLCNQCFREKCGDFITAVMHFREVSFREAITLIAEYLNLIPPKTGGKSTPSQERPADPGNSRLSGKSSTSPDPGRIQNAKNAQQQAVVKNKYQLVRTFTPFFNPDGSQGMRLSCFAKGRKPWGFDFLFNGVTYQPIEPPTKGNVKKHTLYEYVDGNGAPHHLVYRMDLENGRKIPMLFHWNGQAYESGKGEVEPVPYNAPDVKEAEKVYIVEGEKCAAALQWDLARNAEPEEFLPAVTCFLDGAKAFKDEYVIWFSGKEILIFPDNDIPGIQFARELAEKLFPVAKSVKVFKWPEGTPEKWDIADEILKKIGKKGQNSSQNGNV